MQEKKKGLYDHKFKMMQVEYGVKNVDIANAIDKKPSTIVYKRIQGSWTLREMIVVKELFEKKANKEFTLDEIFIP